MKIGLLGPMGYFGSNILNLSVYKEQITPIPHDEFDLLSIFDFDYLNKFDILINCAALINQDLAHTDLEYRTKMYKVNGVAPIELREWYYGFFIHVSSYFVIDGSCNDYANSKYISHLSLKDLGDDTAILTPAHPYGNLNSNNYWGFLSNNLDSNLVLDNVNRFNIISMENFVKCLDKTIYDKITGTILAYEEGEYTKYSMATKLFGKRDNWTECEYTGDIAPRPKDVVFSKWNRVLFPISEEIVC